MAILQHYAIADGDDYTMPFSAAQAFVTLVRVKRDSKV